MCPCGCVQRHDGGEGSVCKLACLAGESKSTVTATFKSQLVQRKGSLLLGTGDCQIRRAHLLLDSCAQYYTMQS